MKSSNKFKYTSPLLLLLVVMACASTQEVIENDPKIELQPKLLFLNYKISKTSKGEKNIALINQKITDGKLKNTSKVDEKTSFGDLECISLDENFNELDKHSIKNPLVKIVEFINDLGNFEKRIIKLDSAQFALRLQLQSKVKYISISELTQSGIKKHLTTEIE